MKFEKEESDITIKIKLTSVELKHVATALKYAENVSDDDEDCDCSEKGCYECDNGYSVYKEFKANILNIANIEPRPMQKSHATKKKRRV